MKLMEREVDAPEHRLEVRNKVERLAVTAQIAPTLRQGAERMSARRVGVLDKDGNVKGYISALEMQKGVMERARIELDLVPEPGKRVAMVFCKKCGVPVRVQTKGRGRAPQMCSVCSIARCQECGKELGKHTKRVQCIECRVKRQKAQAKPRLKCVHCNKEMHPDQSTPRRIARRNGAPPRCNPSCQVPKAKPLDCVDCGKKLSGKSGQPNQIAKRRTSKPRCRSCAAKARRKIATGD